MSINYKSFGEDSILTASDVNNYWMNQTVVQVSTVAEVSTVNAGVRVVHCAQDGRVYARDSAGVFQSVSPTAWNPVSILPDPWIWTPTASWTDISTMAGSAYVPPGRTLDVEWKGALGRSGGGFVYARLIINGEIVETNGVGGGDSYAGIRLTGSQTGTGSTLAFKVQGKFGSGTGDIRAWPEGSVLLRWRIV